MCLPRCKAGMRAWQHRQEMTRPRKREWRRLSTQAGEFEKMLDVLLAPERTAFPCAFTKFLDATGWPCARRIVVCMPPSASAYPGCRPGTRSARQRLRFPLFHRGITLCRCSWSRSTRPERADQSKGEFRARPPDELANGLLMAGVGSVVQPVSQAHAHVMVHCVGDADGEAKS
jgi:hypothetical protein